MLAQKAGWMILLQGWTKTYTFVVRRLFYKVEVKLFKSLVVVPVRHKKLTNERQRRMSQNGFFRCREKGRRYADCPNTESSAFIAIFLSKYLLMISSSGFNDKTLTSCNQLQDFKGYIISPWRQPARSNHKMEFYGGWFKMLHGLMSTLLIDSGSNLIIFFWAGKGTRVLLLKNWVWWWPFANTKYSSL
jgi:hypothetical protein